MVGTGIDPSILKLDVRRGGWSAPCPGCLNPMKEMLYSLYRKLGGSRDQFGWVRKISPPTRVRTPDCPACGDSLHKVHYPGQQISTTFFTKTRQNYDNDDDDDAINNNNNNNNNTKRCVKQRPMPKGSKNEDV
jgi:hypothetical protein